MKGLTKYRVLPPQLLVGCLLVLAGALPVSGTVLGVATLIRAERAGDITLIEGSYAAVCFVTAWSGGAVLWAIAWLVRRGYESSVISQRLVAALERVSLAQEQMASERSTPAPTDSKVGEAELQERILGELVELNANLLLSPAQRQAKARQRQSKLTAHLISEIERAIDSGDLVRAQEALDQLGETVSDAPRLAELQQRLAERRASVETEDLQRETRRAEDMMAVGEFDEANKLAENLLGKYPGSDDAKDLVERVQREGSAFHTEQRRRLYAEVTRSAETRRWRQALGAARKLLETYPQSSEADAVIAKVATLEENARIEEVREMRDHIRDLVRRRRFREAAAVAEEVIRRFPDMRVANALRGQIDKLKRRAVESDEE
jgi:tetratricopeptide (TPR) repeat protein